MLILHGKPHFSSGKGFEGCLALQFWKLVCVQL